MAAIAISVEAGPIRAVPGAQAAPAAKVAPAGIQAAPAETQVIRAATNATAIARKCIEIIKKTLEIFKTEKAFLSGHFLLSSGLHSPNYMQCALVLQKPWLAERLCKELAKKFSKIKIDAVIGPALGGMIVSHEMARALKTRSLFAERVDGSFVLRRGFSLKKNEKLLVVEDVITTGKSIYEVIELAHQAGAKPVAVASIVDRSDGVAIFEQEFHSLLKINIKTYRPEVCPLCQEKKVPLVKPGSRPLRVS